MASRALGAFLALAAAVAIVASIALSAWWAGAPMVAGHTIIAKHVHAGPLGATGCNVGGDGSCSVLAIDQGTKLIGYAELGASALATLCLLVMSFAALRVSEHRKGIATATILSTLLAGAVAGALLLLGPGIQSGQLVDVPIGWGTFAFGGGLLASLIASKITRGLVRQPLRLKPSLPRVSHPDAMPMPPPDVPSPVASAPPGPVSPSVPRAPERPTPTPSAFELPSLASASAVVGDTLDVPRVHAYVPTIAELMRAPDLRSPADSSTTLDRPLTAPPPAGPVSSHAVGSPASPAAGALRNGWATGQRDADTSAREVANEPFPVAPPARPHIESSATTSPNPPPLPPGFGPRGPLGTPPRKSSPPPFATPIVSSRASASRTAPPSTHPIPPTAPARPRALQRPPEADRGKPPSIPPLPSPAGELAERPRATPPASRDAETRDASLDTLEYASSVDTLEDVDQFNANHIGDSTDVGLTIVPLAGDSSELESPTVPSFDSASQLIPPPAPATKPPVSTASPSLPPPRQSESDGPSPACPQCEAPMAWVDEHLRFYCKACRMYF